MTARPVEAQRLALLRRQIAWAEEKTSFYREAFARAGVGPADIRSFADMDRLPLLECAAQEGASAPFFMLALPLSGLLRMSVLHDAAGDPGRPHFYTRGDVARQVRTAAELFTACGVNRASTVLLAGDFADSRMLDLQYALDMIGALTLPLGISPDAERMTAALRGAVPDTLVVWEEALPGLAAALRVRGIVAQRLVTVGTRIAPTKESRSLSAEIAAQHMHILSNAALGATVGYSRAGENGIRLEERLFFAEVLDAAGRSHIEDGAVGELVLSTLTAEAMPVLRYRTGLKARLERRVRDAAEIGLYIMEV